MLFDAILNRDPAPATQQSRVPPELDASSARRSRGSGGAVSVVARDARGPTPEAGLSVGRTSAAPRLRALHGWRRRARPPPARRSGRRLAQASAVSSHSGVGPLLVGIAPSRPHVTATTPITHDGSEESPVTDGSRLHFGMSRLRAECRRGAWPRSRRPVAKPSNSRPTRPRFWTSIRAARNCSSRQDASAPNTYPTLP